MTPEELYAMEAETGRVSEWEPLYRAEKHRADAAEAAVARVRALCARAERRYAYPGTVTVAAIHAALDAP